MTLSRRALLSAAVITPVVTTFVALSRCKMIKEIVDNPLNGFTTADLSMLESLSYENLKEFYEGEQDLSKKIHNYKNKYGQSSVVVNAPYSISFASYSEHGYCKSARPFNLPCKQCGAGA